MSRHEAPEAACPLCGAPGSGVVHAGPLIAAADYLCAAGQHIWRTTWNVENGAA